MKNTTIDINGTYSQFEEWVMNGNEKALELIDNCPGNNQNNNEEKANAEI